MIHLRDDILKSQIRYYEGLIAKHKQNVEVYLTYPVGIGEHPDIMAVSYTHLTLPTIRMV